MPDAISEETVVSFHYQLKNNDGDVLDASEKGEPMLYLHGASNIVPGLEKAMKDRKVGDTFDVKVPPEEGYGERVGEHAVVPRSQLPGDVELEPGMSLVAEGPNGQRFPLWIAKVEGDEVTLDPNHPLAGIELNFHVEIAAIRAATEEELAHGHPHGPGSHAH
jgi:FKBP-type peptidyl-prolyl cis-trans isomerase SlyD